MTNTQRAPSSDEGMRPHAANGNSGVIVTMTDTLGAIFLGFVALSLLIALLRAQARIRELQAQR